MELYERLKQMRISSQKTQKQVAKSLNLSERGYQNYEDGFRLPKLETTIAIADYFNVSIDWLVGRTDNAKIHKKNDPPSPEDESGHKLKIAPVYFAAIESGQKGFEIRKNDRDYKVGDLLYLREYDVDTETYTGKQIISETTYILENIPGIQTGYCVLGISVIRFAHCTVAH